MPGQSLVQQQLFQRILFAPGLTAVVDQSGKAICVAPVGADGDMVSAAENHNIPCLPLGWVFQLQCEHLRMTGEKDIQVAHTPEVNVRVRAGCIQAGIEIRICGYVCIH